jgi:flagellar biosynthetic protein FlhB
MNEAAEQNRSEAPTHYKLAKARERGTVARGADLGFFTSLAAFTAYAWIAGPGARAKLSGAASASLVSAPGVLDGPDALLALTGQVLSTAVRPAAFLAGAVFVVVLAFEIVQTGPVFSTQSLRPDFNRLNPAANLKRLFSLRTLIETGKNLLKMTVYIGLAWSVIQGVRSHDLPALTDAGRLAQGLTRTALQLLSLFLAAALAFAALDQLITRGDFVRRMRMSRREVRRELRDREGDPRMKQRRLQLHREFVKLSQTLRGIRGADVLITNPTHYAVGLKYDPKRMDAPEVVALGSHRTALRLRLLAFAYGVVIVHDPPLAKALFLRGELNRPLPQAFFQPVADIYLRLRRQAQLKAEALADA